MLIKGKNGGAIRSYSELPKAFLLAAKSGLTPSNAKEYDKKSAALDSRWFLNYSRCFFRLYHPLLCFFSFTNKKDKEHIAWKTGGL